ncbi:MAG: hypothetical protein ACFFD3_11635 [Candidatus Thorarchaeota archaeon]
MVIYGRRLLLALLALLTLLGPLIIPAQAALAPMRVEIYQQDIAADPNGHSYLYFSPEEWFKWGDMYLEYDEDLTYDRYAYSGTSWDTDSGSLPGPANRRDQIMYVNTASYGWLDPGHTLGTFFDFANTTNDYSFSINQKRVLFPLAIGQESTVIFESGQTYYSTFNVTSEEFFHLTVSSSQDDIEAYFLIIDPSGRILSEWGIDDGDIEVIPFKPTGDGTYLLLTQLMSYDSDAALMKFKLESVQPEYIDIGGMVEGTLEGSEIVLGADNSVTHVEKAPTAKTYRVQTNSTMPGVVRSFFNLPEITPLSTDMYEPWIFVTSEAYYREAIGIAYMDGIGYYSDAFYYKTFTNESYYLTVLGMDGVQYSLVNDMALYEPLPRNQEFYLENVYSDEKQYLYSLNLGQDSVLKLNSSEPTGGFSWYLWTVDNNQEWWNTGISDSSTMSGATTYYIPKGNYLLLASSTSPSRCWYEFNLGPVLDGAGSLEVDLHRISGVKVDTDPATFYRFNVSLTTLDNVTVRTDVDILNHVGGSIRNSLVTMGNRQDGIGWSAYGSNLTSWELGTSAAGYSMFDDQFAIIALCPYEVENNTIGIVGDFYFEYEVNYDISLEEDAARILNGTSAVTVATAPVWNNITLGDPGEGNERYTMEVTCPAGVWMNFSVYTEDVDGYTAYVYQYIDGFPQYLRWTNLDDTLVGSTSSESGFQFGSITTTMLVVFEVDRTLADEGELAILITPFDMNSIQNPPEMMFFGGAGTAAAADLSGLVLAGGVVAVAAVVIVVVFVAKKRGMF